MNSKITFIIEAINSVNGGAFVVAAKQEKIFGILDFIGHQKADGFEGLFASVHIVSQK